jgi:hypothetical protein
MLFSCQKSSRLAAFPPEWVQAYICPKFDIKRPAPVNATEFYGVAADAQLKAVVSSKNSSLALRSGFRLPTQTPAKTPQAGGADRDRTGDPLVANQVLSQLSYSPVS